MDVKMIQGLLVVSCLALLFAIILTVVEIGNYHGPELAGM